MSFYTCNSSSAVPHYCAVCATEIRSQAVVVDGKYYHFSCKQLYDTVPYSFAERQFTNHGGTAWVRQDEVDKCIRAFRVEIARLERQRDRAEQNYDGACAMMTASPGPEGWEVTTSSDGERSLSPVNWKELFEAAKKQVLCVEDQRDAAFEREEGYRKKLISLQDTIEASIAPKEASLESYEGSVKRLQEEHKEALEKLVKLREENKNLLLKLRAAEIDLELLELAYAEEENHAKRLPAALKKLYHNEHYPVW